MSPARRENPHAAKAGSSGLKDFLDQMRKKRMVEILAGFVGGGWLVYEIVHWVLVVHYHLPEKLLDITIITLVGTLLGTLTWRWFAGRERPGKLKPELILIPLIFLITIVLDINLLLRLKEPAQEPVSTPIWKNSLAVLPFVDLSPQKDQEYFCDGMTEEIIGQLSRIRELKVISRTSVVRYRNTQKSIKEIAGELGVANILEGSIRREGDMIRVSAQLINAENGFHLWSDKYDRRLSGVFAIQDEISQAIATALKLKLSLESVEALRAGRPDNMKLYEAYLQGMYFINSRYVVTYREEDFIKALEMFEAAREIDPGYAQTYLGIAWAYWHKYSLTVRQEDLDQVVSYGEKAYQLDPEYAGSNLARGFNHFLRGEYDQAFEKYRIAFEKSPNNHMICTAIGYSLSEIGLFETAIPFFLKSIELAPFYIFSRTILATCYRGLGEFKKSELYLREALNLNPQNPFCLGHLARHMIQAGRYEEAEKLLAELQRVEPDFWVLPEYKAQLYAARGEKEKALALSTGSTVYSLLGMKDEAIAAMQKEMSEGTFYPYLRLINDPCLKMLRGDPRFEQMVSRAKQIHEELLKKYGNYF
ncbi:MAG: Adenylate cyclase [Candidatus Saccharicenans subterraneus]|uniref:Adenylate cyclase n=1 Tax=Candidatus Saccharicenans subterraneus TaxID=2508984 RepID=A0A3E2BKC9_9BACT|nr:MAG: Adenylate cyclase [Candidatus Saccharicenans subterraneum]